jgi:hypothetical protein
MSTPTIAQALAEVERRLAAGDAAAALRALRPVLSYPAPQLDDARSVSITFAAFARIADALAKPKLAETLRGVAEHPGDAQALDAASIRILQLGLADVAATTLASANRIMPGQCGIVNLLGDALATIMEYRTAAEVIDASGHGERNGFSAWLAGHCWLLAGEIDRAAEPLRRLEAFDRNGGYGVLRIRLAAMLARAVALRDAYVDLGSHALTAWHAIASATLVTHESPHGYDAPMRGRYAHFTDSPARMREGIEHLRRVLAEGDKTPTHVLAAPDRPSRILALAVAHALSLPMMPWAPGAPAGLVVVYNPSVVADAAFRQALSIHRPGEVVFAHVSQWVEPFKRAPDVTTVLAQSATAESDPRDDAELARGVLDAPYERVSRTPVDRFLGIQRTLARLPEPRGLGLYRTSGERALQYPGSPVRSAWSI